MPSYIAFRYSKAKQSTSFIAFINRVSVVGITLGLMALITVVSIMNGFESQLKQRVLGVVPHVVLPSMGTEVPLIHRHIQVAMNYEETEAIVQSTSSLKALDIQGVDPDVMQAHSVFSENMLFGTLELAPGSFNVVIGRALAAQMRIEVGDSLRVTLAGKTLYTPFGRIPSRKLVRVVGIFDLSSQADDSVILMHWQDLKRLQRQKTDQASLTRLFLFDAFKYQEVQDWLKQKGLESYSWRSKQGTLFDAVKMEKNLMFTMLLLIIAVAAFNMVSSLVMVVTEKQSDIAILQTQGMTPKSILAIFLINGGLNGIKGALFGTVLGFALIYSLNPLLDLMGFSLALSFDGKSVPFVIDFTQIMVVIAAAILMCIAASLYPAYRAMNIKPAVVLHNS